MPDWPSLDNISSANAPSRADVDGIVSVEEIWNEIGAPPDNPQARSHTPKETIAATRNRVLRGYDDQALSAVQQQGGLGPLARFAERVGLSVNEETNIGTAQVPPDQFPLVLRALGPQDTPIARSRDVARIAYTSLGWQDYRFERQGRELLVVPPDLGTMTAYLVPQDMVVSSVLRESVPEINAEIIDACQEALKLRTGEAERIEQESAGETP